MAAQASPIAEPYPGWDPVGFAVGGAVALSFLVPGEPEPAHRPRSRVVQTQGKKPWVQHYSDKAHSDYLSRVEDVVRHQIRLIDIQGPDAGSVLLPFEHHAIYLVLRFRLHRPVSYPKRIQEHTRKPDLDNLVKTVLDGLTRARVWKDDGAVCEMALRKDYADDLHPVGVSIDLTAVWTEVP